MFNSMYTTTTKNRKSLETSLFSSIQCYLRRDFNVYLTFRLNYVTYEKKYFVYRRRQTDRWTPLYDLLFRIQGVSKRRDLKKTHDSQFSDKTNIFSL